MKEDYFEFESISNPGTMIRLFDGVGNFWKLLTKNTEMNKWYPVEKYERWRSEWYGGEVVLRNIEELKEFLALNNLKVVGMQHKEIHITRGDDWKIRPNPTPTYLYCEERSARVVDAIKELEDSGNDYIM
jgi:hypothetical protein